MYERMRVQVSGKHYALPMQSVVEVVGLAHTTPVPRGPRLLVGLMHLRGQIVLVVDLDVALYGKDIERALLPDEPLLVVRGAETLIALRVDEVVGPTSDDHDEPIDLGKILAQLAEE
jgi:chemotaxis signal transduction protein